MQGERNPVDQGDTEIRAAGAVRPGAPPGRRGAVVAALMLAMALAALDSTIVSTAIPQIVGDLGGFSVFSWLFSGYLLAVTVTLPVYGKLSDTFGRKPVLITGAVALPPRLPAAAPPPGTWPRSSSSASSRAWAAAHSRAPCRRSPPTSTRSRSARRSRPGCPRCGHFGRRGPGHRRCARRVRGLALDLPDQPADRRARPVAGRPASARAGPGALRACAGSTGRARSPSSPAAACC